MITQPVVYYFIKLFNEYYKILVIDLNKQDALGADLKAIHQINFTAKLDWAENTTMFFIIKEAKETILHFSHGAIRVLQIYFALI